MVSPPHPDPWFKVIIVWVVGFFEVITHNSATVMFWIGAVYGVLNIIALVRREFLKGKNNGSAE
jgi:hypothetical protein